MSITKDVDFKNGTGVILVYDDDENLISSTWYLMDDNSAVNLSRKPSTTSDQSLKRNLEMMRQFKSNQVDFSGWAYKSSLEMVLREGRFCKVTDAELPNGIEYGDVKSAYKNALELSLDNDQLTYVEGYALTELSGGMAFPHAWVIDANGEVIDNTWRMKGTSYFGVPFKSEFVNSVHENFGMYGVIPEIPTEQYNPFKYGFEFYEFGGKGSGFHGHAGRDAANLRGGSVARNAASGSGSSASNDAQNVKAIPSDLKIIIQRMQDKAGGSILDKDIWDEVKDNFSATTISDFRGQMKFLRDEGYLKIVVGDEGEDRIKFFSDPKQSKYEVPEIGKNRRKVKVNDGKGVVIFDDAFVDEPTPSEMQEQDYLDWFDGFKDEVSRDEKNALYDYQDGSYDEVNGLLRGKISEGEEYDYDAIDALEKKTKHVESVFEYESAVLKEDTVVYRGTKVRKIEEIYNSFRSGKDVWYQDKGFTSTTIQEDVTRDLGDGSASSVFLEIRLPKDAKVAPVYFHGDFKDEYEVLIPAGKKLKVVGVHKNDVDGYDRHYKFEYKLILQYMDE